MIRLNPTHTLGYGLPNWQHFATCELCWRASDTCGPENRSVIGPEGGAFTLKVVENYLVFRLIMMICSLQCSNAIMLCPLFNVYSGTGSSQ